MRSSVLTPVFIAVCVVPFACATYENDSGMLGGPSRLDEAGSGGAAGSAAGSGGSAGGAPPGTAGSSSQAGSTANAGAFSTSGTGGDGNEGGADAGMSGMGGSSAGGAGGAGKAGAAGAAGSGGMGGTAGAGGTAGSAGKGGNGGTGGSSAVTCSSNPLSARGTWVATASHSSLGNGMESDALYNPASHMLDGALAERWSTGKQQSGDEWIQIDFGKVVTLSDITLQQGNDPGDFPIAYAVRVSNNSGDFNATVRANGAGANGAQVVIALTAPATGRYLTIRQTGASTFEWWSIGELQVACSD